MLKTNEKVLPIIAVEGGIDHPKAAPSGEQTYDLNGRCGNLPSMGGITYNYNIGDPCMGFPCEHVEPGVSARNSNQREEGVAFMQYSCIGNTARVITGDAKGDLGFVTGKHGGVHTMLWFPQTTLRRLTYSDRFIVEAVGMGLTLTDYPEIMLYNMSPELLSRMNIHEENGHLIVPVAKRIPAFFMGSGKGWARTGAVYYPQIADYDIVTSDPEMNQKYGINELRFGDFVLLEDADNTYGRTYRKGSVTIGVIVHGDSVLTGHGPGVTTLMTCRRSDLIVGEIDSKANLANAMGIQ